MERLSKKGDDLFAKTKEILPRISRIRIIVSINFHELNHECNSDRETHAPMAQWRHCFAKWIIVKKIIDSTFASY